MTKEEELDWLYRLRSEIYVYMPKEWLIPMNNALDIAIKALEQEPCNTDTCKVVKAYMNEWDKPITAEPETGHWEWLTEDKYRCSNCNSETRVDECMNVPMYEFCPFCGAKMQEVEE